jgi:hypothetical protein
LVAFTAPDGWSVEVVDLVLTKPPKSRMDPAGDGPQFLVHRHGHVVAYVRTVPELAEFMDMATLRREGDAT